jgi:hypothetical protein
MGMVLTRPQTSPGRTDADAQIVAFGDAPGQSEAMPLRKRLSIVYGACHTWSVPSALAEAMRLSLDHETAQTLRVCPL